MYRTALIAALVCITGAALAAPPAYVVSKTIPLGAPDHWDYATFDPASHHVLVAHGTQIDVVDADTGKIIGKLPGIHGAHGSAVTPDGTIYADSGDTASIAGFDPSTMKPGKSIPAGVDADGVVYEPTQKLVAVMDGDANSVTLVDPASQTVRATVPLGGSPEFGVPDGAGHLYVNIASTNEIAQVDVAAAKVTARFALPGCDTPRGLAIDPKARRLFSSCLNAKLMVVDADSGHVLQALPIGKGTDAAAFDATRGLVYSSNSDGTLSVLHEAADGSVTALGNVKTAPGARTLAVDPGNGRVFLITADTVGKRPAGHGGLVPKFDFKPGSVKLLFLDPVTK